MKIFLKRTFRVILVLLLLVVSLIWKIDRTPFDGSEIHQEMRQQLASFQTAVSENDSLFSVGWAKENITPNFPVTLVGYRPRGPHQSVHDSLFVRTMLFENSSQEYAIIAIDLLLFPPHLKKKLAERLPEIGFKIEQTYFSATHTHTSFGGWDNSLAGGFITGKYNENIVNLLCDKIISSIQKARKNTEKAEIGFTKIAAPEYVRNRINPHNGTVDTWLRVIKVKKQSGKVGLITTYAAHSTHISKKWLILSGDYPTALHNSLEQNNKVDFSLFCSGMVGSHTSKEIPDGFESIADFGQKLANKILPQLDNISLSKPKGMGLQHLPILLPKSQLRIDDELKVRDWVFSALMGKLDADITVFRLGNILLLGMPCDFSGEISVDSNFDALAKNQGLDLMISSFNGKYIGYITADKNYDTQKKEEVRALNWVGPEKGKYFVEIVESIILKEKGQKFDKIEQN